MVSQLFPRSSRSGAGQISAAPAGAGRPASRKLTDHDSGGIIPGVPPGKNAARPADQWNRFHIVCKGKDLTVKLNGEVVNQIKLDHPKIKDRPDRGFIGFQDHALPLALRRLRVKEL